MHRITPSPREHILDTLKLYGTLDELQNAFDAVATRQFERCAEYQLYISARTTIQVFHRGTATQWPWGAPVTLQ